MPARRLVLVGAALAVVGAAALQHPALPVRAQSLPTFSTPTVVDPYRPGFEPDVVTDQHTGAIYTSTPFGFSTTESFVYRSDDRGTSFHLAEGSIPGPGKPTTCFGGGDTELQVDPKNSNLYLSDLQGLTNFSNSASTDQGRTWNTSCTSVTGAGVDRQWIGIDSNGGTKAVGSGSGDGRLYFDYDNVAQGTTPQPGSNQLVMNASVDGVHYGSGCDATHPLPACAPPAVISPDEGIPGNVVVDDVAGSSHQHSVYAIHSNADGSGVIVSICRNASGDTAATAATRCTTPNTIPGMPSTAWHDIFVRPDNVDGGGAAKDATNKNFASIAVDDAGNLYATWAEYALLPDGSYDAKPGRILTSASTNGGDTWSTPTQVNPPSLGNNVFPWITAGDPGRVDIAWYAAPQAFEPGTPPVYGPDGLNHGTWSVYMAQSTNALGSPSFDVTQASDHEVHFGTISTGGLGGTPDRSLGDFMQVNHDANGGAVISYVNDLSADRNTGNPNADPAGLATSEEAGPINVVHQNGGQGVFAARTPTGPPAAFDQVRDPTGDSFFGALGTDTTAPAHLDTTGASISLADATHLRVTMSTADPNLAAHLGPDPAQGGLVNEWIVSWVEPTPGGQGDGNIFYADMESAGGGAPTFFDGTTGCTFSTRCKYLTYPAQNSVSGSISGGTISWTVPIADVGNTGAGAQLFDATGFIATQNAPSPPRIPDGNGGTIGGSIGNVLDLTPAFTANLALPASTTGTGPGSGPGGGPPGGGSGPGGGPGLPNTGGSSPGGAAAAWVALAALGAVLLPARRRRRGTPASRPTTRDIDS